MLKSFRNYQVQQLTDARLVMRHGRASLTRQAMSFTRDQRRRHPKSLLHRTPMWRDQTPIPAMPHQRTMPQSNLQSLRQARTRMRRALWRKKRSPSQLARATRLQEAAVRQFGLLGFYCYWNYVMPVTRTSGVFLSGFGGIKLFLCKIVLSGGSFSMMDEDW